MLDGVNQPLGGNAKTIYIYIRDGEATISSNEIGAIYRSQAIPGWTRVNVNGISVKAE